MRLSPFVYPVRTVSLQVVEVVAGYTTVRRLIKKQTAQFYAMCQQDAKQQ